MPSIEFNHPHVLSAELKPDGEGATFIEVFTDLPTGDATSAEFRAMSDAVEAQRQQLPPQKKGRYVTFVTQGPAHA